VAEKQDVGMKPGQRTDPIGRSADRRSGLGPQPEAQESGDETLVRDTIDDRPPRFAPLFSSAPVALAAGPKDGRERLVAAWLGRVFSISRLSGRHSDAGLASFTAGLVGAAAFMALALGPGWVGFLLGFVPISLLTSWAVASHA
jgi:hypothetical protein